MKPFEVTFSIGDTDHTAFVTPEMRNSELVYSCLINDSVLFTIRKNNDNRWENHEGNASALCRLIGWQIDHHLKRVLLKDRKPINNFDLYSF
ncbi:MAG TPA: hypothetical protein VFZ47_10130 [Chitinophagaceae bacterium]